MKSRRMSNLLFDIYLDINLWEHIAATQGNKFSSTSCYFKICTSYEKNISFLKEDIVCLQKKHLDIPRKYFVITRKASCYYEKKHIVIMRKTVHCYENTSSLQEKHLVMKRASCYYYKRNISLI